MTANETGTAPNWLSRERELLVAALLLAGLAAAIGYEALTSGLTVDEPGHLVSAHLYWKGQDTLKPRDMPPAIKIFGGWPTLAFTLPLPGPDAPSTKSREDAAVALDMVWEMKDPGLRRLFFAARMGLLVFPLGVACLLWRWGREEYGPVVGLALLAMYVLEPTALAHAGLMKNDIAATFGYLAFWFAAWRYWKNPGLRTAVWLGLGLTAAVLAKLSMMVLLGVAPLLVLARRWRVLKQAAWECGIVCLVVYGCALAACQFDARLVAAGEWQELAANQMLPRVFVWGSLLFRFLPVSALLWDGCVAIANSHSSATNVYLNGEVLADGSRAYFLWALLYKSPLAIQALALAGAVGLFARGWRQNYTRWVFLFLPGALYVGLASLSNLQLGVRLVLPALPFGLLLAGEGLRWLLRSNVGTWFSTLALGWLLIASLTIYPEGLTFFNKWTQGPAEGLAYLNDSNLDWGQPLPQAAEVARGLGGGPVRLAYFGSDNPGRYFAAGDVVEHVPPWGPDMVKEDVWKPEPGLYAISASLLPGNILMNQYRNYYLEFRKRKPVAKAGNAIYFYRID